MNDRVFYKHMIERFYQIHERTMYGLPFFNKESLVWLVRKEVLDRMENYMFEEFKIEKELIVECMGIEIIEEDLIAEDIILCPKQKYYTLKKEREKNDTTK